MRFSNRSQTRLILIALVLLQLLATRPATADDNSTRDRRHRQFLEQRQVILESLQRDLLSVQNWCTEHALPAAASEVAELTQQIRAPAPDSSPPKFVAAPISKSLPIEDQQWLLQLRHHREERAKELYRLARSALKAGFPSLAFVMIGDVIRIDPDHKYARSILGSQLFTDPMRKEDPEYAGEWVSQFERTMRSGSKPHVYHARYGWIPAANVTRYNEGQRPWKGNWVSAEKETELRRDFRNAWTVQSENFQVKTNVSLEAGVQLSQRLEIFYDWLQQNFAAFFDTPQALQDRFEAASSRSSGRKKSQMEVHYYATRDEYRRQMEGKIPPHLETNGIYWEDDRTSYFFDNPDKIGYSTLYHEATHQILDLATRDARVLASRARALKLKQRSPTFWKVGEKSNFWILEGIACYLESFDIESGHVEIGNPDYIMFANARTRLLDPMFQFYMPSQQSLALGKEGFQNLPQLDMGKLYTQGAGFTHFLMQYENGLYKDDLIELLAQIYRPEPGDVLREPSFSKIAGVSYEVLDQQYHSYMQSLSLP